MAFALGGTLAMGRPRHSTALQNRAPGSRALDQQIISIKRAHTVGCAYLTVVEWRGRLELGYYRDIRGRDPPSED